MDGDETEVTDRVINKPLVFESWVSDEAVDLIYQMNRKSVKNRIHLDSVRVFWCL